MRTRVAILLGFPALFGLLAFWIVTDTSRPSAARRSPPTHRRGPKLDLQPNPTLAHVPADVQATVCQQLREADPFPPERAEVFRSYLEQKGVAVKSWSGKLEAVAPTKDGWRVLINVTPRLHGTWFTNADCIEQWEERPDGWHLVNAKPGPGPGMLTRD